jgi:hypothetical protein
MQKMNASFFSHCEKKRYSCSEKYQNAIFRDTGDYPAHPAAKGDPAYPVI